MLHRYLFIFCSVLLSVQISSVQAQMNSTHFVTQGDQAYQEGHWETAIEAWEQALSLHPLAAEQVDVQVRLAAAYQTLGRQSLSFQLLDQALKNTETLNAPARRAQVLTHFSDAWLSIGDVKAALNMADEAVTLLAELAPPRVDLQAAALNAQGNVLAVLPNYLQASQAYQQAAQLAQHTQPNLALKAQINQLNVLQEEGQWAAAQALLAEVLKDLAQLPPRQHTAAAYLSTGLAAQQLSRQPALSTAQQAQARQQTVMALQQAAQTALPIQNHRTVSLAYGYLGQMYERDQRLKEAHHFTRQAIFHALQGAYPEVLYRWQWQAGRLFKAENNTLAAISAYQAAGKTLSSVQQRLDVGYRSIPPSFDEAVRPVYYGLAALLLKQADNAPNESIRQSLLRQARDTVERVKIAELQNYFNDECVQNAQQEATSLDSIDPHTAVLYPIPLQDELVVLLSIGNTLHPFRVAVTAAQLRDVVTLFRQRLQTRSTFRFMYEAQSLYDWLIRPLLPTLQQAQVDTLVFVPDGSLRTIPFSALHDGQTFLIEQFAVATTPGLNLTHPQPINWKDSHILLIGLSDGVQGYSALPNVPKELASIQQITGGEQLLNQTYTLESFKNNLEKTPYAVVHMATHGEFDADPEHTYLLTYEEKLHMNDLQALIGLSQYRQQPVELLTLSACKTAVGDDKAALGLAGVAVKAGASSVMATLWFVDDEATSMVVTDFYKNLLSTSGVTKAKALQQAQVTLLKRTHYRHPAYWGPFLLIGNWL